MRNKYLYGLEALRFLSQHSFMVLHGIEKNLSYGISGSFTWVCFLKHNSKNVVAKGKDLQTAFVLFWYQPQKMSPAK